MLFVSFSIRMRVGLGLLIAATSLPARAAAEMPDAGALFDYGFKGFTVGAELGLSVGYIATGSVYEHEEWRKLVVGLGVGGLTGMASGIVIAVADSGSSGAPMGYFVLRDAGYGTLLGAIMGAITGSLLWVASGTSKDVLMGAAYGTLLGAAAGIGYGVLEARHGTAAQPVTTGYRLGERLRVSLAPTPGAGLTAQLHGRF